MKTVTRHTSKLLNWASHLAHLVISLALVTATVLLSAAFFYDIYQLFLQNHSLIKGFLHALGILLLLWTMVELINTEVKHLQGSSVDASVFVEVALVVIVREIIMLPVEEVSPTWVELMMWTGAATLLGLTYFLLRVGRRWQPTGGQGKQARDGDQST